MAKPISLNKIWASIGTIVVPEDSYINIGWTTEIPPYEYFNYAFNKWDASLKVLNDQGLFEWDTATTYSKSSKVVHNGIHFISRTNTNLNNIPFIVSAGNNVYDAVNWKVDDGTEVGAMIMFDGNTPSTIDGQNVLGGQAGQWIDDSTIPGWYACVDGNQVHGCQNLVDSFVKGKAITLAGVKSGSHKKTLSIGNMPTHKHTVPHSHDASSVDAGSHTHTIGIPQSSKTNTYSGSKTSYARIQETQTTSSNGEHSHSISIESASPASTFSGGGTEFDIQPLNYGVIYIRKCY